MPGDKSKITPRGDRSTQPTKSDSTHPSRGNTPEARARYYSPFRPFHDSSISQAGTSARDAQPHIPGNEYMWDDRTKPRTPNPYLPASSLFPDSSVPQAGTSASHDLLHGSGQQEVAFGDRAAEPPTKKRKTDVGDNIAAGRIATDLEIIKRETDSAKINVSRHQDIEEMYANLANKGRPITNRETKALFNELKLALQAYEQSKLNNKLSIGSFFWKKVVEDSERGDIIAKRVIAAWDAIENHAHLNQATKEAISHLSGEEIADVQSDHEHVHGTHESDRPSRCYVVPAEHLQKLVDYVVSCKESNKKVSSADFLKSIGVVDTRYTKVVIADADAHVWKAHLAAKSLLNTQSKISESLYNMQFSRVENNRKSRLVKNMTDEQIEAKNAPRRIKHNNRKNLGQQP